MELGLVGLGKMGGAMRERMRAAGLTVVGYDTNAEISDATDLADMVGQLQADDQPRVVWVMVPVSAIDAVLGELKGLLSDGDVVIDGGNSRWNDDARRADELAEAGIAFVDCGVSGGVWGKQNGYALMCGGDADVVKQLMPVFDALKPEGDYGFVHAGKVGSGHFAKMVHNGIEYGMMQSYAEGYELLTAANVVENVPDVFESWREGTVIRSWLLDLLCNALNEDGDLSELKGYADDSGEGRWTVEAAIENAVPLPAISAALFARFASRQDDSPSMKAVAAMRNQFGGHSVHDVEPAEALSPGSPETPGPNPADHT